MYRVIFAYAHSIEIERIEYFRAASGEECSMKIMDWKNRLKQRGFSIEIIDVKCFR